MNHWNALISDTRERYSCTEPGRTKTTEEGDRRPPANMNLDANKHNKRGHQKHLVFTGGGGHRKATSLTKYTFRSVEPAEAALHR